MAGDQGGTASSSAETAHQSPGVTGQHGNPDKTLPYLSHKRKRVQDPNDDDDSGVGSDRDIGSPRKSRPTYDDRQKFACPFFKRDPAKHMQSRACTGPGWNSVHRVKEHLYRVHKQPLSCIRCGAVFFTLSLLESHSRSKEACEVREPQPPEGLSEAQIHKLRSKKRSNTSEEERWADMYRIAFPDDNPDKTPSPYYELGPRISCNENELDEYERYLRRELPSLLKRELENQLEKNMSEVETQLLSRLPDTVRDVQSQLFRNWRNKQRQPQLDPAGKSDSKGVLSPPAGLEDPQDPRGSWDNIFGLAFDFDEEIPSYLFTNTASTLDGRIRDSTQQETKDS
ncbi:hypothetical protein GQ53DRAFT_845106 [Thozetella sp. PMI_491]|nr:hypothetical protein GQ53DRAFT_845106 [Thozetella sp. PMI_491]